MDRKSVKHLKLEAKKCRKKNKELEKEDTSSRSILDKFQTIIKSDQKLISKCRQQHCNPFAVFYSFKKIGNDKGMRR